MSSVNAFNLDQFRILSIGKELNVVSNNIGFAKIKTISERENMLIFSIIILAIKCHQKFFSYLVPQPFPKRQILDYCKQKEFANNHSEFDENDSKFSKWVENTMRKGEIAHYEQFLLFPQCFQKACTADTKNQGLFRKWLNTVLFGKG